MSELVVGGCTYRVAVVDTLGGPMCVILGETVFVVDCGNHEASTAYAAAVLNELHDKQ